MDILARACFAKFLYQTLARLTLRSQCPKNRAFIMDFVGAFYNPCFQFISKHVWKQMTLGYFSSNFFQNWLYVPSLFTKSPLENVG